ncbi:MULTISPECIES: biliverdin-producing heme oxygenase [unclassified Pseudoclavibacter]|uniref:biliverdin-producing heme oxygenase n=1 Tax=unclassified Pseudoclavibacter TaxID=2615177 RepID=UPI0012F0DC68|nr:MULTISPECIES: biliverdin-producing heme oxygenase [unclassified Pseudoclavibacter]MBF4459571.1 biliverdin-producing heme oxygenase [Pseudoclavibacter sp. VKM Ac-2867]VXA95702.1 Biliverdin-producing heme oxygenase [Pseudoclavibacter sp. 8L]
MTIVTDTATTISARLRERTSQAHESAERSRFLERLLGGELGIDAWAALLQQYGFMYEALESAAVPVRESGTLGAIPAVELNRAASIAADLEALAPRLTQPLPGELPATRDYAERITASAADPARYLAHHYTRYLGDLSGGQAMRVMLDRTYGLPAHEATFFDFTEIPAIVPFKRAYRTQLDDLAFDEAAIVRLLDEANASFTCNERIFEALDARF